MQQPSSSADHWQNPVFPNEQPLLPPPPPPAGNAEQWQQPIHNFPADFQRQVVKLMVHDPVFLAQLKAHVPLGFFAEDIDNGRCFKDAVTCIYDHAASRNYAREPAGRVILETYFANIVANKDVAIQAVLKESYAAVCAFIYEQGWPSQGDIEFVRNNVVQWAKGQAARSIIVSGKGEIDQTGQLSAQKMMNQLREMDGLGSTYQADLIRTDLPEEFWDKLLVQAPREVLRTGDIMFDKVTRGGFGRKELVTFAAPPNTGKTTVMCAYTAKLVKQGYKGLYISLEQSDVLIAQKIYASIVGIAPTEWKLEVNRQTLWNTLLKLIGEGNNFAVKQLPAKRVTVQDVENLLLDVAASWGVMPDFLAIDYADLLKPSSHYNDYRHQLTEIYTELRTITTEYNIAGITASQANRGSVGAEKVGMEDLAESFDKAAISDILIGISQTEAEQKDNKLRLFFSKNRIGAKYVQIPLKIDFAMATVLEEEGALGADRADANAQNVMDNLAKIAGQGQPAQLPMSGQAQPPMDQAGAIVPEV